MHRFFLKVSNKRKIIFLIGFLSLFFCICVVFPILFINYFRLSGIGYFFMENVLWCFISLVVFFYFLISGVYFYKINVDSYVINFVSYSIFSSFYKPKDYLDINHEMLFDYAFFNRPFSFNTTLMLKIISDNQRTTIKRFNLTFLSKKEIQKMKNTLDYIIAKNK